MKEKKHLPYFGVGPLYGVVVVLTTLVGAYLSLSGYLESGKIEGGLRYAFYIVGTVLVAYGIYVWALSALGKKSIVKYVSQNKLCTSGVYSIVRNPCYTGLTLAFVGVLVILHNLWLLVLPPCYWIILTLTMKFTEEKWLLELYGDEYKEYCRNVNRCIPWFPKKKS